MRKLLLLISVLSLPAVGQVLNLNDLNTQHIEALDRAKTVIIIPGGIMEEHGPYLPVGSDTFINERLARDLAEAVAARPGWTAVITPMVPLGHCGANVIGRKWDFPGSYTVRASTLRAVYMDLGDAFGRQGFKWMTVVHNHGCPLHHSALLDAQDYFHDIYGGQMVHILGIMEVYSAGDEPKTLDPEHAKENGFSVHAGISEQSAVMFVRPDLASGNRAAPNQRAEAPADLVTVATKPEWPGYFGAPKHASAAVGAEIYGALQAKSKEYLLKVLDGADPKQWPRYFSILSQDPTIAAINADTARHDVELERKQQDWLASRYPPPPKVAPAKRPQKP